MKELPNLKELTDEAKEALVVKLWEELQKLQKQLEKKPKNSSLPPAKGFKAEVNNLEEIESKRAGSIGREGGGRQLSKNPDQTIKATVKSFTECGKEVAESMQVLLERYDKIDIPLTNKSSEQALRWSVIFRKVTNGFRSDWGRDLFAAVRSIVNTGKIQGFSAFESILIALNPLKSLFPLG